MMTGLLLLAILGVASAGNLGRHGHGQEFTSEPSSLYNAPGGPGGQPVRTHTVRTNGVFVLDGHACIIRGGELTVTGPLPLAIGSEGVFEIGAGFGSTVAAGRIQISDGLIHIIALSPNDVQGITRALAQSGTTLDQFIQQTGTVSPPQAILEITAGIVGIGGVYININVGVFILLGPATGPVVRPATGPTFRPITGPATGPEFPVTITETAVHLTQTIRQPVTLTKTRTVDRYTTITSPVYNNVAATITNFVKQTVSVPENQVIRSPLPGRVVVNTVPEVTQVVLTVTDTSTQFFVQTALNTVTSTLHHLAPNFNFRTVTVNNPQTSTVVQTITRTSVATVYVTNNVDRTIYSTATVVFTVTDSINNSSPGSY